MQLYLIVTLYFKFFIMDNLRFNTNESIIEIIQSSDNLDNVYSLITHISAVMNKKQLTAINEVIKNKSYLVD